MPFALCLLPFAFCLLTFDLQHPLAVIINPISGTGGRPEIARQRAERAARLLSDRGVVPNVVLTERSGHARELSLSLIAQGVKTIVAWGGDGTVNEVASAVMLTDTALGIVPSGSGNGLARELGIPLNVDAALRMAIEGDTRTIDGGELDGHVFFNIAGIGLDARVAHRFADGGLVRRGFARYMEITVQELMAYRPDHYTVVIDDEVIRQRTMLVAIANGRQYGNSALIAPDATLDDGRLDVVLVEDRSVLRALSQIPRVFLGQIAQVRGVTMRKATRIEVTSTRPVIYHVDGEPFVGGIEVKARILPGVLKVKYGGR